MSLARTEDGFSCISHGKIDVVVHDTEVSRFPIYINDNAAAGSSDDLSLARFGCTPRGQSGSADGFGLRPFN